MPVVQKQELETETRPVSTRASETNVEVVFTHEIFRRKLQHQVHV